MEYSSREVSPPALLLQQLLRAHRIFQLHHGRLLTSLYSRLQRTRFCNTLERYWTRFAANWDVLLHGNPAVEMYHGVKLSSGGELGVGVGEEEQGSGEREVFEDFAGRTDGLVDMVVSRFGAPSRLQIGATGKSEAVSAKATPQSGDEDPWLGQGKVPGPTDGVVFSGVGSVARASLCDISDWMQQIYTYGEHTYGVRDNPTSDRRKRRKKAPANGHVKLDEKPAKPGPELRRSSTTEYPSIPPPIISAVERSLDKASAAAEADTRAEEAAADQSDAAESDDRWTKYLTLGYGSTWGRGSSKRPQVSRQPSDMIVQSKPPEETPPLTRTDPEPEQRGQVDLKTVEPEPEGRQVEDRVRAQVNAENTGYFVIGLKGSLEDEADAYDDDDDGEGAGEWNSRTLLRTLHVEVEKPLPPSRMQSNTSDYVPASDEASEKKKTAKFRVVVYAVRTFDTPSKEVN
ncbi:MAG: hypothetical protein INR71_08670 [Terriglobus roseus]|nr:hypothetical protein [Terriglobus roseus]